MPSVQGVFGRDRILRTCKVRVPEGCMQPEEIRRGAPALAWETALSCPIVTKKLCYISLSPHFMRDFLCFDGEDRAEGVPCGSRVGGKPTYAEAHTLAWSSGSKVLFEFFI